MKMPKKSHLENPVPATKISVIASVKVIALFFYGFFAKMKRNAFSRTT